MCPSRQSAPALPHPDGRPHPAPAQRPRRLRPGRRYRSERNGLACLPDRLQHGRKGFIPVNQRLNSISRQQRSVHHATHYSGQHLQVPGVTRQMAMQLVRRTLGLRGLGAVPFEVPPQ